MLDESRTLDEPVPARHTPWSDRQLNMIALCHRLECPICGVCAGRDARVGLCAGMDNARLRVLTGRRIRETALKPGS